MALTRSECMRAPDLAAFERLQAAAGGNIRLLTLAPEWPGSAEFIAAVVAPRGVVISLGHTNASEKRRSMRRFAPGATMITHLGNGTPGHAPRARQHHPAPPLSR